MAVLLATAACGDGEPELPPTLSGVAFDTLYELGVTEGPAWESFQGVWDAAVDEDGRTALLDLGGPAVHVYDAEGGHLASLDQRGLGEGQLDGPSGVDWSGAGHLVVWDPGASWISTFTASASSLDFVDRRQAFAFGETGFCARGERTWVSYFGFRDGLVVHEIGPEGPVRSFGPAPDVAGIEALGPELAEIAIEELTPSALLCIPAGVLDVGLVQGQIRLHDADGTLSWRRDFEDFRPVLVSTPDGIGLARDFDTGQGSHLLRSVVAWGSGAALVQHELRTQEIPEEGDPEHIESRLIRLDDGTEIERSTSFPLVLAARGRRLVLSRPGPVAGVTVVEVR